MSALREKLKTVFIFPKRSVLDPCQGSEYVHLSLSTHELVK